MNEGGGGKWLTNLLQIALRVRTDPRLLAKEEVVPHHFLRECQLPMGSFEIKLDVEFFGEGGYGVVVFFHLDDLDDLFDRVSDAGDNGVVATALATLAAAAARYLSTQGKGFGVVLRYRERKLSRGALLSGWLK